MLTIIQINRQSRIGRIAVIRWKFVAALLLFAMAAPSSNLGAHRVASSSGKTVLFVCEHGTVKSLLAKILFEDYARETGLRVQAVSRGTHADSVPPPWMVQALSKDHVMLGSWQPQTLRAEDLATAAYVVSFDLPREVTAATQAPRTQWDGLPSVSQDYARGRDAIRARVHQLVDSLKRSENERKPQGR